MTRRRELFKTILRTLALTGSVLTGAFLIFRRKRSSGHLDHTCPDTDPCRNCGRLKDCAVPRAQYYRRYINSRKE